MSESLDQFDDPISAALSSRRIPHSRTGKKSHGGGGVRNSGSKNAGGHGGGGAFNPTRALGRYEIELGSSAKRARKNKGGAKDGPESSLSSISWLDIHEFTPNEDGFVGTFGWGIGGGSGTKRVDGMCILAGSRKGLAAIIESLEGVREDGSQKSSRSESGDDEGEDGKTCSTEDDDEHDNDENVNDDDDDDDDEHEEAQTAIEAEDARINKRTRAFEKNSFRNPKFWMKWKAHVQRHGPSDEKHPRSPCEIGSGYLIFSGNDCARFDGTVTCEALGWDNHKIHGRRVHSRPTSCPVQWKDLD